MNGIPNRADATPLKDERGTGQTKTIQNGKSTHSQRQRKRKKKTNTKQIRVYFDVNADDDDELVLGIKLIYQQKKYEQMTFH